MRSASLWMHATKETLTRRRRRSRLLFSHHPLDLLLGIEKGIGKLLSLSKSTLNDLEAGNVAEEVADGLVRVSRTRMRVLPGMNAGIARVICTTPSGRHFLEVWGTCLLPLTPLTPSVCPFTPFVRLSPFSTEGHMVAQWRLGLTTTQK